MNDSNPEPKAVTEMISLGHPETWTTPKEVLDAIGGFAWWYIDTLDSEGNGAVIIWSFGLPFLPGYLSGARDGRGEPARARPSLNVSIYRRGRRAFYLLQEYDPSDAEQRNDRSFRFGNTKIDRPSPGCVRLSFDCPIPRSPDRLTGELSVEGAPARFAAGLEPSTDLAHRWTPVLGPAQARGVLRVGKTEYPVEAAAYHDRNEGTKRFDDLGIDHWIWGRLITSTRTAVWYLNYGKEGPPVAWGVELASDGCVRLFSDLKPTIEGPRTGFFGLRTWRSVELKSTDGTPWLQAVVKSRVDDGPFYARTLAQVQAGREQGLGLGEWIVPDRIDLAIHRPLVRMAVHQVGRDNSFWLPLFSGPRSGRMARLLGVGGGRTVSTPSETP